MTEIPKNIQDLLALAGPAGARPFDRLQRGKALAAGREAVAKLSLKDFPSLKDPSHFVHLQAALFLQFDLFDEAHQLAQDHGGMVGNWLHAIAHRREPDASNSKYWYVRVKAPTEAYFSICQAAMKVILEESAWELDSLSFKLLKAKTWVPAAFVDLCDALKDRDPKDPAYRALARMQEAEWRVLVGVILS